MNNYDQNEPSIRFDLRNSDSNENEYFQSMFARSIAFENTNRCKSLITPMVYNDNEYNEAECRPVFVDTIGKSGSIFPLESLPRNRKMRPDDASQLKQSQNFAEDDEKLRLLTLDENDSVLQSRIDFLQWQLKQTESSRRMYRTVMEQVSKFLERVHKNLDLVSTKISTSPKTKISRFSRSRSVHTMAGSCTAAARTASGNDGDKNDITNGNRCLSSSPTPTHSHDSFLFSTNSTVIITDTPRTPPISPIESLTSAINIPNAAAENVRNQHSFVNDFNFFKERTTIPISQLVILEKLSQESFRLLRTVHSLLSTPEPDLIRRLTPSSTSEIEGHPSSRLTTSDINNTTARSYESFDTLVTSDRLISSPSPCARFVKKCDIVPPTSSGSHRIPLTIEDESGFSSLSSFQDVNTVGIGSMSEAVLAEKENRPKLRVPAASGDKRRRHQRCNSTHVHKTYDMPNQSNFCNNKEILRVLWV